MSETDKSKREARRGFLKRLGLALTAAVATTVESAPVAAAVKPKVRYGMLLDTRRCVGCHACSVACRAENDVPENYHRSWVESVEKGTFPNAVVSFIPRVCNQCSEPQCVSVCPANATHIREDGIVTIDASVCIGCKYCIQACPYEARFLNPKTGAADKCDFCADRLDQGMEPACVATCFNRARIFGDLNDPDSDISRMIASNAVSVLRQEMGTEPNVFYIGIDYADEQDIRFQGQYIRVNTHRDENHRR